MRRALLLASFGAGLLMGSPPTRPSLAVIDQGPAPTTAPSGVDEQASAARLMVDAALERWLTHLVAGIGARLDDSSDDQGTQG